ncbi:MAG: hypothetical protein K0V04_28250 [Deltaproteobacteria bacterium]|nr:hypothetical protein [Deltaproteobacteria bacterium]
MHEHIPVGLPVVLALAFAPGCVRERLEPSPDFCTNARGDETCAERYPDGSRPYCVISDCLDDFYGCFPEAPGPNCASPCGAADPECSAGNTTESSTGATDTTSGDSETTEGSSSTGPMPCVGDGDCTDAMAPFCNPAVGECVDCSELDDGDTACATADAGSPLCVGQSCVACTSDDMSVCDAQLLLCDDMANTCVGCTAHEECAAGACDIFEGRCFDPAHVIDVGTGQTEGSIAAGLAVVAGMNWEDAVLVLHAGEDFNETATVDTGAVAFINADGPAPLWIYSSMPASPTLTASGADTRVYVRGVRLAQNGNDVGLACDDEARVDVRRARIVQNAGGGIVAQNACELYVENSFVSLNGGQFVDSYGVTASNSTLTILYSTIAANDGDDVGGFVSLSCDAVGGNVRNSIVAAGDSTIDCPGTDFSNSVVDTAGLAGTGSQVLVFSPAWFPNIAMADFHVQLGAPFENIAEWNAGDPTVDIDGDPRPTDDPSPDYAGADVPQ